MPDGTSRPVTVGLDIGTSSVKAIAADDDGRVVARARVPHAVHVPVPGRFEHDVRQAWCDGPRTALDLITAEVGADAVRGVNVAAMVPSLTAVAADGTPLLPGLLYGDERGRERAVPGEEHQQESGELVSFLRWCAAEAPDAAGYWPAQAVANHALSGAAVIDYSTASTTAPLFDFAGGWDAGVATAAGARVDQLPGLAMPGQRIGTVGPDGPALAAGCIDAFAEQMIADAREVGDVLVILGTTLITWAVTGSDATVPGYWVIPQGAGGAKLLGGPSNAGGMFVDWVARMLGDTDGPVSPGRVPVWAPYPRGERAPLNDPDRRAVLADLELGHDAAAVRRAGFEASGFVVRRILDAARDHHGTTPRRLVLTGGGTRVDDWVQAIADVTGLACDCVLVPEGAALGSAFLARIAAGLEEPAALAEGGRWARTGRTVEPDPAWAAAVDDRYARFLELSA